MIKQALDLLRAGEVRAFRPVGDSVLVVTKNAIVKRHYNKFYGQRQDVLALRVGEHVIGNSSAFSTRGMQAVVTDEQLELAQLVPMIPFSVIQQANLDLTKYAELDAGPEETLYRKTSRTQMTEGDMQNLRRDKSLREFTAKAVESYRYTTDKQKLYDVTYLQPQHFAGARLFRIADRRFLLDVDRGELKHGIINPFLVELKESVSTISEAYESLKPQSVKDAESRGLIVQRQGEWFFIPVSQLRERQAQKIADANTERSKANGDNRFGIESANNGILRAGNNRPNRVETFVEISGNYFCKGIVSHTGREHADMLLKSFHEAVPNTSISSWTITGDVD